MISKIVIKKIRISSILMMIALIGFMKPSATLAYPIIDMVFNVWRVISVGIILGLILYEKVHISKASHYIALFQVYLMGITILNRGDTIQAIINGLTIIGEVFLFEYAVKKNFKYFLEVICRVLVLYICVNQITLYLFPEGLLTTDRGAPIYFLGIHNRFIFWILPALCYLCIKSYIEFNKISLLIYIIHFVCIVTFWERNAAGATIGCLMFSAFFILISKRKIRIADYRMYILLYFILWFTLSFFDSLDFWSWLTYGIFEKKGSLVVRINMWETAKRFWLEDSIHFLFGYGREFDLKILTKFPYIHVHNNLLNVAYQGGIVGGMLYFSPFFIIRKSLKICYFGM